MPRLPTGRFDRRGTYLPLLPVFYLDAIIDSGNRSMGCYIYG